MKSNWKARLCQILEYLTLLGPTIGYCIYSYISTLQHVMTDKQVAGFWTIFTISVVSVVTICVTWKHINVIWKRYCDRYNQQLGDLERDPEDERTIKIVASKSKVIESMDFVMAGLPIFVVALLLYVLQNAVTQVINILLIMSCSLMAKGGLHTVTISLKAKGMIDKIGE